ncbi:hypothetical protein [Vampirovibrio chlorellavorus]|uniref:hypothetical protein n=1 Tax=Vampirovibrio chlorellavorus TaxID=758823 RepID=UPI0026ECEF0F|nr:hypothetical protein [Vampirovibrio chlorellavorus]
MGSTATEMGLIGAVVLVATIGLWFLLGNGLKQALVMVKSDMLAQVSKTNATPVGQQEPPSVLPPAALDAPVPEPVEPTPTVITAGSNGNETYAKTDKALQALIERSLQEGTMTEAQADLFKAYVKQVTRVMNIEKLLDDTATKAQKDFEVISRMEVQFEGKNYLVPELAAKAGLEWDTEYSGFYAATYDDEQSEWAVCNAMFEQLEESGILDEPKVDEFMMTFWRSLW